MTLPSKTFLKSALERVLWTAVEAGAAFGLAHTGLFPVVYIPVATVILAAIKSAAARKIGNPNTAAIGVK